MTDRVKGRKALRKQALKRASAPIQLCQNPDCWIRVIHTTVECQSDNKRKEAA